MREINEAIEKEKIEQMGEVRSKEREREKIIHRDRTGKVDRRRKRRKWRREREREKCGKIKK